MLWTIIIAGIVAVLLASYLFDIAGFRTIAKDAVIGMAALFGIAYQHIEQAPWREIVPPQYTPYALIAIAVLGILFKVMTWRTRARAEEMK